MGIAAPSTPTANPAAVKARWNMVAAVAKHEVALKGMVPLRAELGDCWESAHREARGYFRVDQSSSARRRIVHLFAIMALASRQKRIRGLDGRSLG